MTPRPCHTRAMATKRPRGPRDANQLAKLIADMARGGMARPPAPAALTPANAARRKCGLNGGRARAQPLSTVDLLATLRKSLEARRPLAKAEQQVAKSEKKPASPRKGRRVS